MAVSLDSHVVDRSLRPGPSGLNSRRAHVHVCPRSQEKNGGEGIVAPPRREKGTREERTTRAGLKGAGAHVDSQGWRTRRHGAATWPGTEMLSFSGKLMCPIAN